MCVFDAHSKLVTYHNLAAPFGPCCRCFILWFVLILGTLSVIDLLIEVWKKMANYQVRNGLKNILPLPRRFNVIITPFLFLVDTRIEETRVPKVFGKEWCHWCVDKRWLVCYHSYFLCDWDIETWRWKLSHLDGCTVILFNIAVDCSDESGMNNINITSNRTITDSFSFLPLPYDLIPDVIMDDGYCSVGGVIRGTWETPKCRGLHQAIYGNHQHITLHHTIRYTLCNMTLSPYTLLTHLLTHPSFSSSCRVHPLVLMSKHCEGNASSWKQTKHS